MNNEPRCSEFGSTNRSKGIRRTKERRKGGRFKEKIDKLTKLAKYRPQKKYTMYSKGVRHEITYQARNSEGFEKKIAKVTIRRLRNVSEC